MKRTALFVLGVLALTAGTFAQAPDAAVEKALAAAPRNLKAGAAVIKFKADGTYDTLKPGTNRLICYDRSGQPGQQPFAVQCSSVANIPRPLAGAALPASAQTTDGGYWDALSPSTARATAAAKK